LGLTIVLVVDLHCAHGHHFEGWFASADDLSSQKARGLLTCPVCGDHDVTRRPSAPHLNTSGLKERAPDARSSSTSSREEPVPAKAPVAQGAPAVQAETQALQHMQALYLQAVRHVVQNTEDVGERFADEARSMHHGDSPERAIRGQASAEEKQALRDEGIEVMSLPLPGNLKGTLQ
jgi:hypothetical protein